MVECVSYRRELLAECGGDLENTRAGWQCKKRATQLNQIVCYKAHELRAEDLRSLTWIWLKRE